MDVYDEDPSESVVSPRRSPGDLGEDQLDSTGSSCFPSVADILDGDSEYVDVGNDLEARFEDEDEDAAVQADSVDQGMSIP